MDTKIYQQSDKILIRISGRIVLDECDKLKNTIISRITSNIKSFYLDLSAVDFIDSAGLGVLVGMKVTSNKNHATMGILSPSKEVSDILVVSKLDSIFDISTGQDAQTIISSLAQESNILTSGPVSSERQSTGNVETFQAPPSASSPPPTSQNMDSNKSTIDRICKEAVVYMKQKDFESAGECYRKVLQIDPNYIPALNNLGIVYEKRPEWHSKAIIQWERVLELSQSNGDQKHVERAQKHLAALQQS